MSEGLLAGQHVLVVGASSGIGRAVALEAAAEGASVVAGARRFDLLRELVDEAGPAVFPVQCDVRSPISCELAVKAAVSHLEGLDSVVFATGVNHLAFLQDTPREDWLAVLETNLVGAAILTRTVLPHLQPADRSAGSVGGRLAYLSSHSVAQPWPGLGAYAASKAGLDAMTTAWRAECADVVFTRVVVGPTITGMADAWDPELAASIFDLWREKGLFDGYEPVEADVVAKALIEWMVADDPPADLRLV
ncbi:MAG: SDR family NAD(P)-dependent oxidoreductase [Actinobacteria bacterium]|nr:SDR family NAD(P)-dependent oxidoreductase [Actinomycetota bacterium]